MFVAPLAGAWIEIESAQRTRNRYSVAPLAGAWIEMIDIAPGKKAIESLPSRERGLKSFGLPLFYRRYMSLPSRERGLKYSRFVTTQLLSDVAPLAGAWIEILFGPRPREVKHRRSPRGSVD